MLGILDVFLNAKKVLGLDIGSGSIKLAELSASKKGYVLESFAIAPTPPNSIAGGEILDTVTLSEAVRSLLGDLKSKRNNIVTGIWGTAVIIKKVSLPKMEANLVAEQIKWEAEQYIPFDINDINMDYHIFKKPNPNPEIMDVLLVAAKKDFIFKFAEVVETAEKHCVILDVEAFALANCFFQNYGDSSNEIATILNVGSSFSNFVVIQSGEVLFCRDVPVGGVSYTNEISRNMGISFEEAEALKISAASGQETPPEIQSILTATHDGVAEEIRRTFDFYTATGAESAVQKVYVCGGGSRTPGLVEGLGASLQLPVEYLNAFTNIGYSKKFTPEYITQINTIAPVAMGLAMRKLGEK